MNEPRVYKSLFEAANRAEREERERFDAWLTREYAHNSPDLTDHIIEQMWKAWQSAQYHAP